MLCSIGISSDHVRTYKEYLTLIFRFIW